MTIAYTYKQTFYRIEAPPNTAFASNLAQHIKDALENESYPHIRKQMQDGYTISAPVYLFYDYGLAYDIMQNVMRSLGLLEEWSEDDIITLDGTDELEIDDSETSPKTEDWRVVEEVVVFNARPEAAHNDL